MASQNSDGLSTSTAEPSSHGPHVFPPFDSTTFASTLIWLALTFGLLFYLMSRIALPRVEDILHTRTAKITSDLNEAHAAREKSEAAAAEHDKTIAAAKAKAQALAQQTQAKINAENDAKRQSLETQLNGKLSDAEKQIVETKAKAMANVETVAADAAAAIVERITGRPADAGAVAAAVASVKA